MSRFLLLPGMFALALAPVAPIAPNAPASDSVVAWGAGGCGLSGYGQSCVPSKNNKGNRSGGNAVRAMEEPRRRAGT